MKRFAAHSIFLPEYGFLKYYVIETADAGNVSRIFPLTEEIDSVEWYPGVILLCTTEEVEEVLKKGDVFKKFSQILLQDSDGDSNPLNIPAYLSARRLYPYLLYPFDFTCMKPVSGTRHKLLR